MSAAARSDIPCLLCGSAESTKCLLTSPAPILIGLLTAFGVVLPHQHTVKQHCYWNADVLMSARFCLAQTLKQLLHTVHDHIHSMWNLLSLSSFLPTTAAGFEGDSCSSHDSSSVYKMVTTLHTGHQNQPWYQT